MLAKTRLLIKIIASLSNNLSLQGSAHFVFSLLKKELLSDKVYEIFVEQNGVQESVAAVKIDLDNNFDLITIFKSEVFDGTLGTFDQKFIFGREYPVITIVIPGIEQIPNKLKAQYILKDIDSKKDIFAHEFAHFINYPSWRANTNNYYIEKLLRRLLRDRKNEVNKKGAFPQIVKTSLPRLKCKRDYYNNSFEFNGHLQQIINLYLQYLTKFNKRQVVKSEFLTEIPDNSIDFIASLYNNNNKVLRPYLIEFTNSLNAIRKRRFENEMREFWIKKLQIFRKRVATGKFGTQFS